MQLSAFTEQFGHGGRIAGVVFGLHFNLCFHAGGGDSGFVALRQFGVFFGVDVVRQIRAAFPPAGVVVKRCDFVKAEFFVVVWANPFHAVNRAFFQRGVNFTGRQLLRYYA